MHKYSRFRLCGSLELSVPDWYEHKTAITALKRKLGKEDVVPSAAWDSNVRDKNFPNADYLLTKGEKIQVELIQQTEKRTTTPEHVFYLEGRSKESCVIDPGIRGLLLFTYLLHEHMPIAHNFIALEHPRNLFPHPEQGPSMGCVKYFMPAY